MIKTNIIPTNNLNFTGKSKRKSYKTGTIIGGAAGAGLSVPAIQITAKHYKPVETLVNGLKKIATLNGKELDRFNNFLKGQRLSDIKAVNQYSVSKMVKSKKVIFSGDAGRALNNWVRTWGKMSPGTKVVALVIPSVIAGTLIGLGSMFGKEVQKKVQG